MAPHSPASVQMVDQADERRRLLCSRNGRGLAIFIVPVPQADTHIQQLRSPEQELAGIHAQRAADQELADSFRSERIFTLWSVVVGEARIRKMHFAQCE